MVSEHNELIMELWARMKSHIQPKERLEVADILVVVFDEFGMVDDSLLDEDLDKELRAAARSHLSESEDELEGLEDDDDSFSF
jgi:ATP-dependent exoDNAse (exonuclease V) alpha subunit